MLEGDQPVPWSRYRVQRASSQCYTAGFVTIIHVNLFTNSSDTHTHTHWYVLSQSYSLHKMSGRAGRPGFDKKGVAIVMTSVANRR